MHQIFKSEFFNFEFLRILSTAPYGGCEIGEALQAASNIKDNDPKSWCEEWARVGSKAEVFAKEAQKNGDRHAARAAFFRAANYFRASQYMLNDRSPTANPEILPRLEKSRDLFKKGISLLDDATARPLSIPFEKGIELPGYLYIPKREASNKNGRHPLVICLDGGDSTQEEMFIAVGSSGPRRGYAVLTFDGPGQGILLKRDHTSMRPDFEVVIAAVLDHLEELESESTTSLGLDLDKIAVVGHSLGAYFALRSACDERIKACISIDPPYDMWDLAVSRMPGWFVNGWTSGWISDAGFNMTVALLSRLNFQLKWELLHAQWIFGKSNAAEGFRALQEYTLRLPDGGEFLQQVKCPVLVSGAAASLYFDPEISVKRIYRALDHLGESQKECWIASTIEEGGLQAKIGAFELGNYRIFNWCDRHLRKQVAN